MGEVHDWRSCKCLTCQRLLLLAYNERLGESFSRECVRRLRSVYLELLDVAESRSKDGVGKATFSAPAFRNSREGTATPSRPSTAQTKPEEKNKSSELRPKEEGGKSEEEKEESAASEKPEEEVSATSGQREGEEAGSPVEASAKSSQKCERRRSRSRRRQRRSSGRKSDRRERSSTRGRRRRSRSHVEVEGHSKRPGSPARIPEHQGTSRAAADQARASPAKSVRPQPSSPRSPPRPSHFDPVARRAAPPPSARASSRNRSEGERKERDRVLPRKKPQEPDHPPPGHRDNSGWVEYQAFPKSQGSQGYRYWPGGYRGRQPTESKGRTKREKNLNYRLWNEYDREQERR